MVASVPNGGQDYLGGPPHPNSGKRTLIYLPFFLIVSDFLLLGGGPPNRLHSFFVLSTLKNEFSCLSW